MCKSQHEQVGIPLMELKAKKWKVSTIRYYFNKLKFLGKSYSIVKDSNAEKSLKNTMKKSLLNKCHLVSISKNVVFYVFLVVRIY